MRYQGESNVPGAPGNFPGRLVAGNPFSRFTDEEKRNSIPVTFTQAFKGLPGGAGNLGGMQIAQAMPQAMGLGGPMQMGPGAETQGMPAAPNVFSVRPAVDIRETGPAFGGSLNIPIGQKGRINVSGRYSPLDEGRLTLQGVLGQPQGQPGFGVDFSVNRRLNPRASMMPSMMMGGMPPMTGPQDDLSIMGRYGAKF
mgnify:CR=1 FL=1